MQNLGFLSIRRIQIKKYLIQQSPAIRGSDSRSIPESGGKLAADQFVDHFAFRPPRHPGHQELHHLPHVPG